MLKFFVVLSLAVVAASAQSTEEEMANNIQCTLCKTAVKEVESLVQSDATKDKVTKTFEGVCSKLPGALGSLCTEFVDNNISDVIDMVVSKVDALDICTSVLHVCTAAEFYEWTPELALFAAANQDGVTWSNCDSSHPFQGDSLNLTPFPLVPGADTTATITGKGPTTVSGGNFKVVIKYAGITAKTVSDDICNAVHGGCPVNPNTEATASTVISLPSFSPKGKYTAQLTVTDQTSTEIGCMNVQFSIQ